jgi:hypothetical protein
MEKNNPTISSMPTNIHANVMRRVHTIHALRPLMSGALFASVLALASLYAIGREVWVAKVVANMPNPIHVIHFLRFFEVAFFNTTTIVQILCIAVLFSFGWLARDFARTLRIPVFA